jgi:hypothetical protein
MNEYTAPHGALAMLPSQPLNEDGWGACCVVMGVSKWALGFARDENYLMAVQRTESNPVSASNAVQCGISHALVAERQVMRFFVLLRFTLLSVRQVRNGMHGGALLAKAKQEYE